MVDTTRVLWRKIETVYGTDAVPTAAANAALTRNFKATPIAVDQIDRNLDRSVRGRTKSAPSNARQTLSYELEAAGSGAAGTAPAWFTDLQACGMDVPTISAGVSATIRFAAIGVALSALSVYHWEGNQKSVGLGARGTFGWDFTAGAYPFFKLDMQAMLPTGSVVSDNVPGAPTLAAWKDPLEVNTTNTDFLLDGFAAVLRSFTGDVNANVKARNLVGGNYIQRGNHGITGKIVMEAPTIASKDYFGTLRVGNEIVVQLIHGVAAGSIVQFDSSHLQILQIERTEEDDVSMFTIDYALNAGTTPDDLIITAK